MKIAVYILVQTLIVLIDFLQIAMFIRAILSWFDPTGEWKISAFLFAVTEPIILPIRRLCEKMNWFQQVPLDIPFMLTWLLLMVVQVFLQFL